MQHTITLLTVLKTLTVILALVFLTFAARAWGRHKTRSMGLLTLAIALITAAVFIEGVVFQMTGALEMAHVTEAAVMLVGFFVLVLSVLLREPRRREPSDEEYGTRPVEHDD